MSLWIEVEIELSQPSNFLLLIGDSGIMLAREYRSLVGQGLSIRILLEGGKEQKCRYMSLAFY